MISRNQIDRLFVAGLLILMLLFFLTSCCPKITESITTKVDTLYVYKTDTVIVHEVDTFRTEFNVDSLLDILNGPIPANQTLSTNTHKGVTTKLSVKNGKLVCESTIDSLQHVIDSVRSSVITVTNDVVKVKEIKKPDTWFEKLQKWFFWVVIALFVGYIVAKTQTYWTRFIPIR
jgi:hypothetical protein